MRIMLLSPGISPVASDKQPDVSLPNLCNRVCSFNSSDNRQVSGMCLDDAVGFHGHTPYWSCRSVWVTSCRASPTACALDRRETDRLQGLDVGMGNQHGFVYQA